MKNNIQEILDKQGRTQAFLCRELNKSANTVSSWCRGKSEPTLSMAKQIADLLGVTLNDLIISTEIKDNKNQWQ